MTDPYAHFTVESYEPFDGDVDRTPDTSEQLATLADELAALADVPDRELRAKLCRISNQIQSIACELE